MIAYVVPAGGIAGGIKVAYQFVDRLGELGVAACIATPDGQAHTWFRSMAPVACEEDLLGLLGPDDLVMFSLPHDYERLASIGVPLAFHCQGTDPLIDPIICDPDVAILTCWSQAADYVQQRAGRTSVDVGMGISDAFFLSGDTKRLNRVAYMPRQGAAFAEAVIAHLPDVEPVAIDGRDEERVAMVLKRSSVFVASAEGEWFGLPTLEAMAAGCIVLSPPVLGGMGYLRDGVNCVIGDEACLGGFLARITDHREQARLMAMRHAAIASALDYRVRAHRERVRQFAESLPASVRRPIGWTDHA
jgi:glycosyltransferase involved in cell wall biosynthesis